MQLKETERYLAGLAKLGDVQRLTEALVALKWALENNPLIFPCMPGSDQIRIVKTEALTRADGTKVRCRVWVKTEPTVVELLVIEAVAEP